MKGFIVLFKVEDENSEEFKKLLMEDCIHKTHNISKIADVEGVCGDDDYESSAETFFHEL